MNMGDFLKAYCTNSETKVGTTRSAGFTMCQSPDIEVPDGFREVIRWADKQFRRVWVNPSELSTITYCERDIIVMQHDTQVSYDKEISDSNLFYENH